MQRLIEGVGKFMGTVYAKEQQLFAQLAGGQSPEVMLVTCSDSRVDPSLITQTKPGELFVLRNAGNFVPPMSTAGTSGEVASLEYGVSVLGVTDLIVCGHSDCGAVKAVMNPESAAALSAVPAWLEHAGPTRAMAEKNFGDESEATRLLAAIEINALVQIEHLRQLPFVAEACDAGKLRVHAWVYDIGAGKIRAFDSESSKFEVLEGEAKPVEGSPVGKPADWPL